MRKLLYILLFTPTLAFAAGLTVPQGGTGTTSVPANFVVVGKDANHLTAMATSSLGITGTIYTGTYPIVVTGTDISIAFGTTTANNWSQLQTFVNASSTFFTAGTFWLPSLGTPAGTLIAVDPFGKVIATTTTSGVTSVTATYPILSSGGATPNISTAFSTTTQNNFSLLNTFASASSTLTTLGTTWLGLTNALLSTDQNGKIVATTSIGTNLLTANTFTVNATAPLTGGGTAVLGGSVTVACATCVTSASAWPWTIATTYSTTTNATTTPSWFQTSFYASSTIANPSVIDVLKTLSATTTNFGFTNLPSAILSTNASGVVVASSSIGTNYLTGTLGTINTAAPLGGGGAFTVGGTLNLTCTTCITSQFAWPWNMLTNFSTTTDATTTPAWFQMGLYASSTSQFVAATTTSLGFTGIKSALLGTDASGQVVSTTSIASTLITGDLFTVTTASPLGGAAIIPRGGTLALTCATCDHFGWPWTSGTTYSTTTNATTTPSWFQTTLYASSTVTNPSVIDNLKTINATTTSFSITGITNRLLATDNLGNVIGSTTIGTNLLTGTLGTINTAAPLGGGGAFTAGGTLNLTCTTCATALGYTAWGGSISTTYGTTTIASTTPAWFMTGLFASSTSQIQYASTTAISAATICLTTDVCRTTWPAASPATSTNPIMFSYSVSTSTATSTYAGAITVAAGQGTSTFAGGISASQIALGTGTSTAGNGFNIGAGCYAINNTCLTQSVGANPSVNVTLAVQNGTASTFMRSDAAPALSQAITPSWTALHNFTAGASTSLLSIQGGTTPTLFVGGSATTTIRGDATSTFAAAITVAAGQATSTFAGAISATQMALTSGTSTAANGFNIAAGCYAKNNVCLTQNVGTVTSVTLATPNSTLTLGGTNPVTGSGTINADINLTHANTWTALQQFQAGASTTLLSVYGTGFFGGSSTTTISGDATSTFAQAITVGAGQATSTFGGAISATKINTSAASSTMNGIQLTGGCFAMPNGACLAAGATPGGTGTEIQYRLSATAFGAVTSSAFNGSFLSFGTTTSRLGTLTVGSSTAPQFVLSDNTGANLWAWRNAGGNLYLSTSTATATSTNTNPFQGYIEFPNTGGCIGCSDIVLANGVNLLNAEIISASSTVQGTYSFETMYTVPTGRKAMCMTMQMFNGSATTKNYAAFMKTGTNEYQISATTSVTTLLSGSNECSFVLTAGQSLDMRQDVASPLTPMWVHLIEFDALTPVKTVYITPVTTATTTLYTVTSGAGAVIGGVVSGIFNAESVSAVGITSTTTTAITNIGIFQVKTGQTAYRNLTGTNALGPGTASVTGYGQLPLSNSIEKYLGVGDSLAFKVGAAFDGLIYVNVYEH